MPSILIPDGGNTSGAKGKREPCAPSTRTLMFFALHSYPI